MKKILVFMMPIMMFSPNDVYGQGKLENLDGYKKLRNELLAYKHSDTLTNWDILILSIAGAESNYYKTTNENYHGYLQISRVYVKEVNQRCNRRFTYADARDWKKSIEIFNLMNEYHNPKRNHAKAIRLHNSGSKYYNKVMRYYNKIKKYEGK